MTFWCVVTAGIAIAPNFQVALVVRFLCGVAEGADIVVLPMMMNRVAPIGQESLWLGIFYVSNIVGVASGSSLGGFWEDNVTWTPFGFVPWQTAYIMNAILMFPLILIAFFVYRTSDLKYLSSDNDDDQPRLTDPTADPKQKPQPLLRGRNRIRHKLKGNRPPLMEGIKMLLTNSLYVCILLGPLISLLCTGAYSVYMITYVVQEYGISKFQAGSGIALINMVAGGSGTFLGGIITDSLRSYKKIIHVKHESIATALLVPVLVLALGCPIYTLSFFFDEILFFWIFNTLATLTYTAAPAPTMSAIMWHTEEFAGAMGISFYMVTTNVGMSIAPPLLGFLLDKFPDNQQNVMMAFSSILYVSWLFRVIAW